MSSVLFLPLACPSCSGDLVGRATDLVAFCRPCRSAWRCDAATLDELRVAEVMEKPPGDGALIYLPFWIKGAAAIPAFYTARPLTLARIAAKLLDEWPARRAVPDPPPFGARIPPDSIGQTCRLARIAAPSTLSPLALLALPARIHGERFLLPRYTGELYLGDVLEAHALRERIFASTASLPSGKR